MVDSVVGVGAGAKVYYTSALVAASGTETREARECNDIACLLFLLSFLPSL